MSDNGTRDVRVVEPLQQGRGGGQRGRDETGQLIQQADGLLDKGFVEMLFEAGPVQQVVERSEPGLFQLDSTPVPEMEERLKVAKRERCTPRQGRQLDSVFALCTFAGRPLRTPPTAVPIASDGPVIGVFRREGLRLRGQRTTISLIQGRTVVLLT